MGKRVGDRAGTVVGVIRGCCRSLSRFRLAALSSVCLCGKRLVVVEFLLGAGKFRDRQVAGHAQLRNLVFSLALAERVAPEHLFAVPPFGYGIAPPDKRFAILFP